MSNPNSLSVHRIRGSCGLYCVAGAMFSTLGGRTAFNSVSDHEISPGMPGIMLSRGTVTYDLSLLWSLYTVTWDEWVDITIRNEVRKAALWISNWIVYPSCKLLKNFLLYMSVLPEWRVSVYHGRTQPPSWFTDIYSSPVTCQAGLWEWWMRKPRTLELLGGWEEAQHRTQITRAGVSESDALPLGKKEKPDVRTIMGAGGWGLALGLRWQNDPGAGAWVVGTGWCVGTTERRTVCLDRGVGGSEEKATKSERWAELEGGVPCRRRNQAGGFGAGVRMKILRAICHIPQSWWGIDTGREAGNITESCGCWPWLSLASFLTCKTGGTIDSIYVPQRDIMGINHHPVCNILGAL